MAVRTNIKRSLGATYPVGASQVVLFIPDHGRDGDFIDQQYWVDEALNTMGKLFRGSTAFPPGRGVWRDDEAGGTMLKEQTVMVVSYVAPELLTPRYPEEFAAVFASFRAGNSTGGSGYCYQQQVLWNIAL